MPMARVRTKTIVGRLTQPERTAATRQLIMEAALSVLEEDGLSGATTVRIQKRAGVTRGRLLHHFPSRDGLLVAAVQHLATARLVALKGAPIGNRSRTRIRFAIDALWSTYQGPLFWVAMELWLGARTDDSLRKVLLPEERQLGAVINELCAELFGEHLVARPGYTEFRDILISSMRGVAMTYALDPRTMETDPHRTMWYRQAEIWLASTPGLDERSNA